jgi:hypothetical protein
MRIAFYCWSPLARHVVQGSVRWVSARLLRVSEETWGRASVIGEVEQL